MASNLTLDVRKIIKEHVFFKVQMKNTFWVWFGFKIMALGAWIAGANLVEEFPMSLIQPVPEKGFPSYFGDDRVYGHQEHITHHGELHEKR